MNTGTYDVFVTVWGMKMYHLVVANRRRKRPGPILKHVPSGSPRQLSKFYGQHSVHQGTVDPFEFPVGVTNSYTALHSLRVEDHQIRPEPLVDEAQIP